VSGLGVFHRTPIPKKSRCNLTDSHVEDEFREIRWFLNISNTYPQNEGSLKLVDNILHSSFLLERKGIPKCAASSDESEGKEIISKHFRSVTDWR